jgi:hypothetical protein
MSHDFRTITGADWQTGIRNARIRREHREAFHAAYMRLVRKHIFSPAVAATGTSSARQGIGVCDATAGE